MVNLLLNRYILFPNLKVIGYYGLSRKKGNVVYLNLKSLGFMASRWFSFLFFKFKSRLLSGIKRGTEWMRGFWRTSCNKPNIDNFRILVYIKSHVWDQRVGSVLQMSWFAYIYKRTNTCTYLQRWLNRIDWIFFGSSKLCNPSKGKTYFWSVIKIFMLGRGGVNVALILL